jgi:hypothetical protein
MESTFESEFNEEQALTKKLKPHLRFSQGDRVTHKTNDKVIMAVVSLLDITFEEDYVVEWLDFKKEMQRDLIFDAMLDPAPK